jgi:GAF domain-containing protein
MARRLPWFLEIQSDDPRLVRQSHLLQILIALTTIASLRGGHQAYTALQLGEPTFLNYVVFAAQLGGSILFAVITFGLLHRGRFLPAVHLFFITLNAVLISLLFSYGNIFVFPYLLLISVVSIAALQSIRASALYFVVIISIVTLYLVNNDPEGINKAIEFGGVALFLVAPAWIFANDLRLSRDRANRLAGDLEISVASYAERTEQLQDIVEIGRIATASLDKGKLLRTTVDLIRERFGFYHVRILLLSSDGSRLVIEEASGEGGRDTAHQGHQLTIGQVSIVGWVALNHEARIALDVGEDPYYFNDPSLPETHSEVALPLITRGRLLGVLDVHSRETNAFQEEDVSVLQVMADQIANGLDNAQLFEEITHQAGQLTELQTITNLMNQQATTRNALHVIADKALPLLNADGGGVFLYRPAINELKLIANLNVNDTRLGESLEPGAGLSGRAFAENKTQLTEDGAGEGGGEDFVQAGISTAVAVPLRRQNEPIGVMTLTRSQNNEPFKLDEIQIAELLAAQVSAVIINNQLVEETSRLIRRERNINQAAAQIRRSLDAKTILDTMTEELGYLLGSKVVKARLFPQQERSSQESHSQESHSQESHSPEGGSQEKMVEEQEQL